MGTKKIGHLKDDAIPTIFAHVKAKKKRESSIRRSEVAAKTQVKTTWTIYDFKEIKIKEY